MVIENKRSVNKLIPLGELDGRCVKQEIELVSGEYYVDNNGRHMRRCPEYFERYDRGVYGRGIYPSRNIEVYVCTKRKFE